MLNEIKHFLNQCTNYFNNIFFNTYLRDIKENK